MNDYLIIALGVFSGEALWTLVFAVAHSIIARRREQQRHDNILAMRNQMIDEYAGHAEKVGDGEA